MSEPQPPRRNSGMLVAIGSILGVGIGAAVGAVTDNLSTGIWIGAVIGVGLGMLAMYLAQ